MTPKEEPGWSKPENVDTVVLCRLEKSSEFGAILWLFCPEARVAELRNWLPS
jgi:hypothetical protein